MAQLKEVFLILQDPQPAVVWISLVIGDTLTGLNVVCDVWGILGVTSVARPLQLPFIFGFDVFPPQGSVKSISLFSCLVHESKFSIVRTFWFQFSLVQRTVQIICPIICKIATSIISYLKSRIFRLHVFDNVDFKTRTV